MIRVSLTMRAPETLNAGRVHGGETTILFAHVADSPILLALTSQPTPEQGCRVQWGPRR